jgi:NADPH:quinone reductase-like Zn-dependent oxidoreductase
VKAASVPLAGLTAWQALFDHGHLAAGQTVLIHGAGGGVGMFAVQLARATGARVVATARGWSRDLVIGLGAEQFIDVETQRFEEALRSPVDLVFDLVGGLVLERSWSVIKPGGALVSVVEMPSADKAKEHRARGAFFVVDAHRQQLIELARRLDAGELKTILGATFPLERGRDAFQAKQAPGIAGKVVLEPSERV